MFQEWTDDRLVWDPEKFGNLTDIIVKADKLWLPELALMNGYVVRAADQSTRDHKTQLSSCSKTPNYRVNIKHRSGPHDCSHWFVSCRADELMHDYERIRVLLKSDGSIHWEPGGIFRTTCDIDITFFPFDAQVRTTKNTTQSFTFNTHRS